METAEFYRQLEACGLPSVYQLQLMRAALDGRIPPSVNEIAEIPDKKLWCLLKDSSAHTGRKGFSVIRAAIPYSGVPCTHCDGTGFVSSLH